MGPTTVNIKGADNVLRLLQSLPAAMVSKNGGPVGAGLRKGARVLLKQEKANLQSLIGFSDESTGLLMKNLVVTRGKAPSSGKGERYLVRVRRKTYPNTNGVTTTHVAFLFEYGTEKQPPRSFIVTAFKARAREAIDVAVKEVVVRTNKLVAKLARQGGRVV